MTVRTGFSLLGYAAGAYFGAPGIGMMIGTAIGNYVDPVKMQGPTIGDGGVQTTRAGVAINLIYGRIPVVGTVLESGPLVKIEVEEEQPKGGPVQVSERALKTFAILIGQNGLGGPLDGIEQIKLDGKIFYDAGPAPTDQDSDEYEQWQEAQVSSSKFLEKVRFYLGTDDQMPDPALEAIRGVGTTPAYRRRAYLLFDQFDITDFGVRIPQVEVVAVGSGTVDTSTFVEPVQFGGSPFPWASNYASVRDPRKSGVTYQYGFNRGTVSFIVDDWRDTLAEALVDASAHKDVIDGHTPVLRGWIRSVGGIDVGSTGVLVGTDFAPWDSPMPSPQGEADIALVYSRHNFDEEFGRDELFQSFPGVGNFVSCSYIPDPVWARNYFRVVNGSGDRAYLRSGVVQSIVGYTPGTLDVDDTMPCGTGGTPLGSIVQWGDFYIIVRAIPDCGQTSDQRLEVPDSSDFYYDRARRSLVAAGGECATVSGSFLQLQAYAYDDFGEGGIPKARSIDAHPVGPTIADDDPRNTEAFWEAAYARAVDFGEIEAGLTYPDDYPVEVTSACQCSPVVPGVTSTGVFLWQVQQNLCERVGLSPARLEVSELTDIVKGFKVAKQMTAAMASVPLQQTYAYARGEWDSKLRFPKLGGPILFTITEDDLLAEDGLQELTRGQAYEVPQKVHCVAYDETTFVPLPQTVERFSPDVLAKGQKTISLPLVLSIDETRQAADRDMKVSLANQEGGFALRTWIKFLFACATDVFGFNGRRYRVDQVRIDYYEGIVEFPEARRDRQSAYTSNLTGVPALDATRPTSPVTGPTLFAAMNLPSLREQDNTSGVYVAATGVLASWPGCVVMMSVDGGATFHQVTSITPAGRVPMGYLTAAVGDSIGESPAETLHVDIYGGDLRSISSEQMTIGMNLAAILDTDHVAELVQYHDAEETAYEGRWDLPGSGVDRGLMETQAVAHALDSQFVTLEKAVFVPIDSSFAGTTLIFRAVGLGTSEESNPTYELVFDPPTFILDGGGA